MCAASSAARMRSTATGVFGWAVCGRDGHHGRGSQRDRGRGPGDSRHIPERHPPHDCSLGPAGCRHGVAVVMASILIPLADAPRCAAGRDQSFHRSGNAAEAGDDDGDRGRAGGAAADGRRAGAAGGSDRAVRHRRARRVHVPRRGRQRDGARPRQSPASFQRPRPRHRRPRLSASRPRRVPRRRRLAPVHAQLEDAGGPRGRGAGSDRPDGADAHQGLFAAGVAELRIAPRLQLRQRRHRHHDARDRRHRRRASSPRSRATPARAR